jgi:acyl dehydratase
MRYFEDFEVGQVIELGSQRVDEAEMVAFAREYDPQPFHLDPEKGKVSLFGGLAASGWYTGSLMMRMLVDSVLNNSVSLGSPGVDELRWPRPVFANDILSARMTILEARQSASRPNMGIIRHRCEVLNQQGAVVMSMVAINFFGRRPDRVVEPDRQPAA